MDSEWTVSQALLRVAWCKPRINRESDGGNLRVMGHGKERVLLSQEPGKRLRGGGGKGKLQPHELHARQVLETTFFFKALSVWKKYLNISQEKG